MGYGVCDRSASPRRPPLSGVTSRCSRGSCTNSWKSTSSTGSQARKGLLLLSAVYPTGTFLLLPLSRLRCRVLLLLRCGLFL